MDVLHICMLLELNNGSCFQIFIVKYLNCMDFNKFDLK